MEREWKVGDRVRLEGVVVNSRTVVFDGGNTITHLFSSQMARATLIKPAPSEPAKLDVTKPMRLISDGGYPLSYVASDTTNGNIYVRFWDGSISAYSEEELENIPEEKIKGRRVAHLLKNGSVVWGDNYTSNLQSIVGRASVEITEGEGWELEEVK